MTDVALDPAWLERQLVERTIERDLARDLAASLEAELALVTAERDAARLRLTALDRVRADSTVGILMATHGTDFTTTPRVVEDDIADHFVCQCHVPTLPGVSHSSTVCRGDHDQAPEVAE